MLGLRLSPVASAMRGRYSATEQMRRLLFSQGQQGVMYIPKPQVLGQQVLYQDSAGTEPVTADGQPVGLMLDLSKGLEKGPELVTNGTFDNGLTQWAGGAVLQSGAAFIERDDAEPVDNNLSQVGSLGGKTYEVGFDIISGSGQLLLNENTTLSATPGRVTFRVAPASGYTFRLRCYNGANALVDNVSVRELPGNHATQATAAAKPLYRTDGVLRWSEFDGVDDHMVGGDTTIKTAFAAVRFVGGSSSAVLSVDDNLKYVFGYSSSGVLYIFDGVNLTSTPFTPDPIADVLTAGFWGAGKAFIRVNGIEVATGDSSPITGPLMLGRRFTSTNGYDWHMTGREYAVISSNSEVSLTNIEKVENYMADLAGVTL